MELEIYPIKPKLPFSWRWICFFFWLVKLQSTRIKNSGISWSKKMYFFWSKRWFLTIVSCFQPTMDISSHVHTDLIGSVMICWLFAIVSCYSCHIWNGFHICLWVCTYFGNQFYTLLDQWLKSFPKFIQFVSQAPCFLLFLCTSLNMCLSNWNFTLKEVESQRIWVCDTWIIAVLSWISGMCQFSVYLVYSDSVNQTFMSHWILVAVHMTTEQSSSMATVFSFSSDCSSGVVYSFKKLVSTLVNSYEWKWTYSLTSSSLFELKV